MCARSAASSLSFSNIICQITERAQPRCHCHVFNPSEMGVTHVHFIRPVASTRRSELNALQNLRRN